MKNRRLIVQITLLILAAVIPALPANAQSAPARKSYIACWAANLNAGFHTSDTESIPQKKYYSSIFSGQSSQQGAIQNAYTQYLRRAYSNDNTGPGRCGVYDSQGAAESWLDRSKRDDSDNNRQVFDTGWSYSQ